MNRNTDVTKGGKHRDAARPNTRKGLYLAVDILLLAVITAAIFFLVVLLTPLNPFAKSDKTECTLHYTVELTNVEEDVVELLLEGDRVVDAQTGSVIGEVVLKDKREYTYYSDVAEKSGDAYVAKKELVENRYTVILTLHGNAVYEEGVGYTVERSRIAVGREYELHLPSCAVKGVCVTLMEE